MSGYDWQAEAWMLRKNWQVAKKRIAELEATLKRAMELLTACARNDAQGAEARAMNELACKAFLKELKTK